MARKTRRFIRRLRHAHFDPVSAAGMRVSAENRLLPRSTRPRRPALLRVWTRHVVTMGLNLIRRVNIFARREGGGGGGVLFCFAVNQPWVFVFNLFIFYLFFFFVGQGRLGWYGGAVNIPWGAQGCGSFLKNRAFRHLGFWAR